MSTEELKKAIVRAGGNVDDLPDNLMTTLMQRLCDTLGIDTSDMTDKLTSSYLKQIISEYSGGSSGGGSAEIPTCTVKFVLSDNAYSNDYIAYTKHEGGVTSIVSIDGDTPEEDRYEYTFENVVCDSVIYFCWWYEAECGDILIDGGAEQITNGFNGLGETLLFKAQSEPNTVSTITLEGYDPLPEW